MDTRIIKYTSQTTERIDFRTARFQETRAWTYSYPRLSARLDSFRSGELFALQRVCSW